VIYNLLTQRQVSILSGTLTAKTLTLKEITYEFPGLSHKIKVAKFQKLKTEKLAI